MPGTGDDAPLKLVCHFSLFFTLLVFYISYFTSYLTYYCILRKVIQFVHLIYKVTVTGIHFNRLIHLFVLCELKISVS